MGDLALDDLPVGAVLIDPDTAVVVAANQVAAEVLGRPVNDLVEQHLSARIVPERVSDLDRLLDDTAHTERSSLVVQLDTTPPRWVELTATATDAGVLVMVRDATEQVRTFRVLRESVQVAVVADDTSHRLWGPVGRIHPEDRPAELAGSLADRLHPEDAAAALEMWMGVADTPGARSRLAVRARLPGTVDAWGKVVLEVYNLKHVPEIGGILVTLFDLQIEENVPSLARTSGSYLSVAEAAPVGIILTGHRGFAMYFNEASQRLVPGIGAEDAGLDRDWPGHVRAEDRDEFREWVEKTVAEQHESSRLACFNELDPTWLLVTIAPRVTDGDEVLGFVVTLQDVTAEVRVRHELEGARERLLHLATHDALTGLANRTLLAEVVDELHARRARLPAKATAVGCVVCDLDGFKDVNDRYGHSAGDEVLVAVSDRLRTVCRADDLVVRLGGDEFLVLVRDVAAEHLSELADRIAESVRAPIDLPEGTVTIGVSLGTAMLEGNESVDDLLHRADVAMYEHKRATG